MDPHLVCYHRAMTGFLSSAEMTGSHPKAASRPNCVPSLADPMMELTGSDPSELDGQQEMEDFEENAYAYASVDGSAEASVLTEQAMKEMAYYNVL